MFMFTNKVLTSDIFYVGYTTVIDTLMNRIGGQTQHIFIVAYFTLFYLEHQPLWKIWYPILYSIILLNLIKGQ